MDRFLVNWWACRHHSSALGLTLCGADVPWFVSVCGVGTRTCRIGHDLMSVSQVTAAGDAHR